MVFNFTELQSRGSEPVVLHSNSIQTACWFAGAQLVKGKEDMEEFAVVVVACTRLTKPRTDAVSVAGMLV